MFFQRNGAWFCGACERAKVPSRHEQAARADERRKVLVEVARKDAAAPLAMPEVTVRVGLVPHVREVWWGEHVVLVTTQVGEADLVASSLRTAIAALWPSASVGSGR